jgi:hypothetical protein
LDKQWQLCDGMANYQEKIIFGQDRSLKPKNIKEKQTEFPSKFNP